MRDELRATLHELEIEHGHSSDHEAVWPVCARRHAVMDRARAALLADTPSVEPLDVERLARAITAARRENPHLDLGGLSGDSTAGLFAAYYEASLRELP